MGITAREYIIEASGAMKRLPKRVLDNLIFARDAIPEYAGTTQRVVSAIIENDGGKAVRILDAHGYYWEFDDEGHIHKGLQAAAFAAMDLSFPAEETDSKVINLTPEIKRREFKNKHRWDVTKDILDQIAADIWPAYHGPLAEIASVKGRVPKKTPLTWEARRVLPEISAKLSAISYELSKLSDPALKGLAFEARRTADFGEDAPLWRSLADECDLPREILSRRRTGKGVWYAVLEIFQAESHNVSRSVLTAQEKCDGKDAAIQAARKLIVAHADKFSDGYSIETNVYTDLEWTPNDD
jgi:hypothetical protein